ncbi:hypothetical protein CTAYLR_001826 [Chrysophaeum taylorii]|uniref:Large ribosomal subunit protein bL17c n=1 Tax=Chrysophaeum taylorii TaxID=2483200 RepID=A0AAD7U8A5_9STRA|nr:hypothetical protein CTAYLR_001826 [Chrysophaeum taylorii]
MLVSSLARNIGTKTRLAAQVRGMARNRKLGRTSAHRTAMLRNMVTSLIKHERIQTTTPKAKTLRPYAEKLIRFGKEGTLHAKQLAATIVREQGALRKLFEVLGPRYAERRGGYTRILKLAQRRKGDGADMSVIEFVDRPGELRSPRPPA